MPRPPIANQPDNAPDADGTLPDGSTPPRPRRVGRTRNPELTREAILAAAREVFASRGYRATTVRAVAAEANITHGTIYLYFRDRDDLLYQLSEESFRELLTLLRQLPRTLEPLGRLRALLLAVIDYGLTHPEHYHLIVAMRPPYALGPGTAGIGPMAGEVYALLFEALSRATGSSSGRKRSARHEPDTARVDAWTLLASVHGVVNLYREGVTSRDEAATMAARLATIAINGLLSDG